MPAPPLLNTLEGGSDTTAITTGNSGGSSGNAFSTVTGTCTYSATHAAHGSLAAFFNHTAANQQSFVNWTALGSITTDVYWRCYVYMTGLPNVGWRVVNPLTSAAAVSGRFNITTAGHVSVNNAANSTTNTGTGTVMATNQWVRLEGHILSSTTVGVIEMRLWNTADSSGAASDTCSLTAQVLGANTDRLDFGLPISGSGATFDPYLDDIAVRTASWIGPSPQIPLHPFEPVPFFS